MSTSIRLTFVLLFAAPVISAQNDTLHLLELNPKGMELGIRHAELIDQLMLTMPGLGSNAREMLTEQSVKPFLMPPRALGRLGTPESYALAACLEFYLNFDNNYKVNLSPDFIRLQQEAEGATDLESALRILTERGTVSAAVMPYDSPSIPRAVFATETYRIANYLHLFLPEMKARQKIFHTRKALMRGNPVLVELNVPEDFEHLQDTRFWTPAQIHPTHTLSLLVVGYDQELEAFELRGFFGPQWGHHGYLWMDYEDFGRLARNAYVLLPLQEN